MATIALSLAGQFVGGLVGGPIGATIGRALGAMAGSAVDNAVFGDRPEPAGSDFRLTGSAEGGAIPRLYGWGRLGGNIIWATELEEISATASGAKGGMSGSGETELAASFAIGLCQGEVSRLGRIWADGQVLETEGLEIRFHTGSEEQEPDSLIAARQGADHAPAYRGLCYIVFERLPLGQFGNRIPNISVELCRVAGALEPAIRAVTVIPGATEFGYDPTPRVRLLGWGETANENTHLSQRQSDWTLSIDELQALCPNLRHVSLVVSWFGSDLRAGQCDIRPKVESATRNVQGVSWQVTGLSRGAAQVVSSHDGAPAYGGTPSDGSVRAAIADLKARGLQVTLYPIVMMDIPAGNALADPYTGLAGQPAFPWRGRITCHPAPGRPGTADRTAAADAQVAAFFGTGSGWDYRRFILHYANMAKETGCETLLIGSELRGLTTIRGAGDAYPAVAALTALAGAARAIVGAGTKLVYAADWSEFSGHQPPEAPGDLRFHLDPLWASAAIDAVGIDNYMPLADWREGEDAPDAALAASIHDPAYLAANIAGGEGYDWYYASAADRLAGARSPILDGAQAEPWVWRFKDLAGWWGHAHHERIGGVRQANPTGWVPRGKPIWFTELGCGAVDKGANQPNTFGDDKSSEDARPHFSAGTPDPLMQRQFLRAHLGWWGGGDAARNPESEVYAGPMVDPERIYLWTWDARPFPAFPNDLEAWSDGVNHATGHWLTGRLGALAADELIAAVAHDYGVPLARTDIAAPLVYGAVLDGAPTARDAMTALARATGLDLRDATGGIEAIAPPLGAGAPLIEDDLVRDDGALTRIRRGDPTEMPARLALSYGERARDYLSGSVTAALPADGATLGETLPLVLDADGARTVAERLLRDASGLPRTLELTLPPSLLALEPGDRLTLTGETGSWRVSELRDGLARRVTAREELSPLAVSLLAERGQGALPGRPAQAVPALVAVHLPAEAGGASELVVAARASPWPEWVEITEDATGHSLGRLQRSAGLGELLAGFGPGPLWVWDEASAIELVLYDGHLASRPDHEVLAGANRLAVDTGAGWEVIGFAAAELIAPRTYRLTRLLRGQRGTDAAMAMTASGARVLVLDERVTARAVPDDWLGETVTLRAFAGAADASGQAFAAGIGLGPVRPLSPAQLRADRDTVTGDIALSWVRRSRADTDAWALADAPLDLLPETYELAIFAGATELRRLQVAAPAWTYSSADQTADFGAPAGAFTFAVSQVSPVLGPGHVTLEHYRSE